MYKVEKSAFPYMNFHFIKEVQTIKLITSFLLYSWKRYSENILYRSIIKK